MTSALGLEPDAPAGILGVSPSGQSLGAVAIRGLRFAGADISLTVDATGAVTSATGATIEVR